MYPYTRTHKHTFMYITGSVNALAGNALYPDGPTEKQARKDGRYVS